MRDLQCLFLGGAGAFGGCFRSPVRSKSVLVTGGLVVCPCLDLTSFPAAEFNCTVQTFLPESEPEIAALAFLLSLYPSDDLISLICDVLAVCSSMVCSRSFCARTSTANMPGCVRDIKRTLRQTS